MSLYRITAARKIIASTKMTNIPGICFRSIMRWRSNDATTGSRSALKVLAYGISTTGIVLGGSLIYANYNPSFRYKIDEYIPGFGKLADVSADKWVHIVDIIKPRPSDKIGLKKESGAVLESPMPSSKPNEIKKHTPPFDGETVFKAPVERKAAATIQTVKPIDAKESSPEVPESLPSIVEATTDMNIKNHLSPSANGTSTKDSTGTESVESSNIDTSAQKGEEFPVLLGERHDVSKPVELTTVVDPEVPSVPTEEAVATEKEISGVTVTDKRSEHCEKVLNKLTPGNHSEGLKEASEAETLLQEAYDKYQELDNKTYELHKVLIEAEKRRKEKVTQAINTNASDKSVLHCTAEDAKKVDKEVETALMKVAESQIETNKVGQELVSLLDKASGLGLKSKVEEIRNKLSQLHVRAMMGAVEYDEVRIGGEVSEEYHQTTEKVKEWIKSELGATLPQADSLQEAIILMLTEKVKSLMQKIDEAEKDYQSCLASALMKQKEELDGMAEEKMQVHLQEQKVQLWKEAMKKQNEAVQRREEELKEQLFIQNEAHTQHLSEALQVQAGQLEAKWAGQMEAKLIQQESHYQLELVKSFARLRTIEALIDAIANAGEITRHQQSLRTACDALITALEQADLNIDPCERHSFRQEVSSLREAAEQDHFLLAMLDSIPQEAINSEHGIQSEAGLRQRFSKVKKICKQVALVPEAGGGLGTYTLSYLNSFLAIDVWKRGSTVDHKDPVDMDTFELLQQADHLLQEGNMERAISFINYLQGEPKQVARDWLRDAQLHLETKLAIQLIQNYMAATSLSIIQ